MVESRSCTLVETLAQQETHKHAETAFDTFSFEHYKTYASNEVTGSVTIIVLNHCVEAE